MQLVLLLLLSYLKYYKLGLDGLEASPLGVHVAGSFQGWNPGGTAMELGEDGLYRASFVAVQGDMVQYKFIKNFRRKMIGNA